MAYGKRFGEGVMKRLAGYGDPNKLGCMELIARYGFEQLGGGDACRCSHFMICGFHIDVSCHKSEHCVRVFSDHMYRQAEDEIQIAALVLQQLGDSAKGYRVRYCEWGYDHVNGHWEGNRFVNEYKCCYCSAPRSDAEAYLCAKCLRITDAVSRYPFGVESSARKCPACESSKVERDLFGFSEMERTPIVVNGQEIGSSMVGQFPKQDGESIFRCLGCGHHWHEKNQVR